MRKLVLCADDYALSPAVSNAIRELLEAGRLNATSVMMRSPEIDEEAKLLLALPQNFQIGLHLTLTRCFSQLPTIEALMLKSFLRLHGEAVIKQEIEAQLELFRTHFGRDPDFIDGHQHCHLLPQISETLIEVLHECQFKGWLRQTHGAGVGMKAKLISFLSRRFGRLAQDFKTNASFSGSYHFNANQDYRPLFQSFLHAELIMCHPGRIDETLKKRDTVLIEREIELAYFQSDVYLQDLEAAHVVL
jgi:chitin disaccharide deacetylase